MARAPFQVLVFPYYKNEDNKIEYAIFRRVEESGGFWQAISGGGEDNETFMEAAKRESWEEAQIPRDSDFTVLDSIITIPVVNIVGKFLWGNDVYVVKEYCFSVEVKSKEIELSSEHQEYKWVSYEEAIKMLKWDSNRNALWELNERLLR